MTQNVHRVIHPDIKIEGLCLIMNDFKFYGEMKYLRENVVAEIKLSYTHPVKSKDRPRVMTSKDAFQILNEIWGENMNLVEEFHILLIDRSGRAIGHQLHSIGGTNATVVDVKLIFSCALKCNASSIILAHNHPSGRLRPSQQDITLTKNLAKAGKLLGITIADHLILSHEGEYYSFADEGML